jgi:UDP-2-acetamido-2-deoxy-ribo-hexuluronate aminotransferase
MLPFVDLKAQYARIKDRIRDNIDAVLEHGAYINGPEVKRLEDALCEYTGSPHAIGVSSGTDALMIPLMAMGVGPGDAVFVPSFTFTATAEVIVAIGAEPVFVDVDPRTFLIDTEDLRARIATVEREGRLRLRAIVPVDLFGLPADYPTLTPIAAKHDMFILADAAQSLGGKQGNRDVGNLAPLTSTSFFPAKPLGGYGDGGAIFTNDPALAEIVRSIRSHGAGEKKYDIVRVGMNGRLDTLQAAILLAKLEIFSDELTIRESIAKRYDEEFADAVATPQRVPESSSAWAQYSILTENRDRVADHLRGCGVPTAIYYPVPMHLQPAYREFGEGEGSMPVSERICNEILSLPIHPYLGEDDIALICNSVREAVR